MSDDLLSQMTSALADEHDGATAVPGATRSRVIRTLAERKPRRRKWFAIGIPAFVVFGGSTAWAAATGHLPEIIERAVSVITGDAQDIEEAAPTSNQSTGTWTAPPADQDSDAEEEIIEEAPEEAEEESETQETESQETEPQETEPQETESQETESQETEKGLGEALAPPQGQSNTAPPAEDHTDLLTYRAAHRAHFQRGDCPGAIRGYRKYIQEQPAGSFALEANYNLGVCLVRIGDAAEAKKILQPFANGTYGSYRKSSAQKLIDAL